MEPIGDNYIAYTLEDLKHLAEQAERLNKGNGLEVFLKLYKYKEIASDLFAHTDPPQVIELTRGEDGISYINQLHEDDQGKFIQFLQNRFLELGKVLPNNKIHTFLSAVSVALEQEKSNRRIALLNQRLKGKRKGKGL